MNKESIKASAAVRGYRVSSESERKLVLEKTGMIITIDSSANRITTAIGKQKLYNFVTGDTIDQVSKHLLK